MTERETRLLEAIRAAFAGVRRGAITIHEAEVIDSYGGATEREAARELDTEDTWEGVPNEVIPECQDALRHLDPESWRFYLPAYMTWAVKHFRHNQSIVSDFTIYACALSDDDEVRARQLERFKALSEEQAGAVCRFLRFMAANGDFADDVVAEQALEQYRGRFCSG